MLGFIRQVERTLLATTREQTAAAQQGEQDEAEALCFDSLHAKLSNR